MDYVMTKTNTQKNKQKAVSQSATGPPQRRRPLPLCLQTLCFGPFPLGSCHALMLCTYLLHSITLEHLNSPYHNPHLSHSSFCLPTLPALHTLIFTSDYFWSCNVLHLLSRLVSNLAPSCSAGCTAALLPELARVKTFRGRREAF